MRYAHVIEGTFLSRPNRFIARVLINGNEETVHVKNTGRCRELLVPGCRVYLSVADTPGRKTKYDLIATEKARAGQPPLLINMDSQAVNDVAEEYLRGTLFPAARIRREVTYGSSRFDFYLENGMRKAFVEVKGVTLEQAGIVRFPDAPTERGVKHLCELEDALGEGYEAYVLFVIQMKGVQCMCPNDSTHKAFGDTLRRVAKAGVRVLAVDCTVTPEEMHPGSPVPVLL